MIALTLTFTNFLVFMVSRNQFWVTHPGQAWLAASNTRNRTYLASEFERNLSCYQPLSCLRSGGAFISQLFIRTITETAELVTVDLNLEQKTYIIVMVGTLWRIICLTIFLATMSRLLNSLKAALLLTNTLMFVLAGLPLWLLGSALTTIPLGFDEAIISRANDAFYYMSYQDLWFYDYGFIAIIPLAMYALAAVNDVAKISRKILLLVGFLVATFYEAFVPLLVLSGTFFVWRQQKKLCLSLLWLIVGQIVWTVARMFSIRFLEPSDPNSVYYSDTSLLSLLRNFSGQVGPSANGSPPSIALQLVLVSSIAIAAGSLCALAISKLNLARALNPNGLNAITSVTLATVLVVCGNYLMPVKAVELGRQSLGLTDAVFVCSFAITKHFAYKNKLNASSLGNRVLG